MFCNSPATSNQGARISDASFDRLVKDHYRSAFNFAYRITGNVVDAEDLVQETYLRAYRFFSKYDPQYPAQSWLFKIMLNANVDLLRRRGKLRTTSFDANVETAPDDMHRTSGRIVPPDEQIMNGSVEEPLQNGLLSLPSQFRTAVLLADVEGMSYEEIADVMHTSVGTVRSRVHRGRKQLRKYLLKDRPAAIGELSFEL